MIQQSQKSSSDIIGQTKNTSYVKELIYQEILAMSNIHAKLTNLKRHYDKHNLYYHELTGNTHPSQ